MFQERANRTSDADLAQALASLPGEAAQVLDAHVLAKWHPAAVDPAGGFHQAFSDDWRRLDDGDVRDVVHQSRLTWSAAAAGFPDAARHGLAFLAERQWDARCGGFFWRVDRSGRPTGPTSEEKHSYGQAFAIFAAATHALKAGDDEALGLAKAAFDWLDRYARDEHHGGYLEVVAVDGAALTATPARRDAIGTLYGLKSANTHLHLLEAFTALYAAWPAAAVRQALAELLGILRERIVTPAGALGSVFTRDWRPVSPRISFGHDLESAHLMIAAAEALGATEVERTAPVARRLVDQALSRGWDHRRGGLFHTRSPGLGRLDRSKVWWVQAEALAGLQAMHAHFGGETPCYGARLVDTWRFVCAHQLDPVHGGWFARLDRRGRPLPGPKSDAWTDAYHQTRALIALAQGGRASTRP